VVLENCQGALDVRDRGSDDDAEANLRDARVGDVEGIGRIEGGGNADDCRRVTRQDKTVGGEVSRVLRAEGAEADPDRQRPEEQDALLREQGDEKERDGGADQGADNAVEALGQDRPARAN